MPAYRRNTQKPQCIPLAAFAVNVASELLNETSESPLVLKGTPSSLRKASVIPHCNDQTAVFSHNKKDPFPYKLLKAHKKSR